MTNGDKIRAMTDEELAKLLDNCQCPCIAFTDDCNKEYEDEEQQPTCEQLCAAWLRKEADE